MFLVWTLGLLAMVTLVYSFVGLALDDEIQWQFGSSDLRTFIEKRSK